MKLAKAGDIVFFQAVSGMVRPAMVVVANAENVVDLSVFVRASADNEMLTDYERAWVRERAAVCRMGIAYNEQGAPHTWRWSE